jgi:hypothetical protein
VAGSLNGIHFVAASFSQGEQFQPLPIADGRDTIAKKYRTRELHRARQCPSDDYGAKKLEMSRIKFVIPEAKASTLPC